MAALGRMRSALRARGEGARKLARGTQGASVVEYALLMSLVSGSLVVGTDYLSAAVNDTLAQVGTAAPQALPQPSLAAAAPRPDALAAEWHVQCDRRTCPQHASTLDQAVGLAQPLLMCTGLALSGAFWCSLYNRRRAANADTSGGSRGAGPQLPENLFRKRQGLLTLLSNQLSNWVGGRLTVAQLMSDRLTAVPPTMPSDELRQLMKSKRLRHLVVCEGEQRLLGVISDRDLGNRQGSSAAALMTPDPLTVPPDMPAGTAVTLLVNHTVSCLPVVDAGRVVGILTTTDVLLAFQCLVQLQERLAVELRSGIGSGETADAPQGAPANGG